MCKKLFQWRLWTLLPLPSWREAALARAAGRNHEDHRHVRQHRRHPFRPLRRGLGLRVKHPDKYHVKHVIKFGDYNVGREGRPANASYLYAVPAGFGTRGNRPIIGLSLVYRSKGDDKAAIKRVKSDTRINCAERKQARLIG